MTTENVLGKVDNWRFHYERDLQAQSPIPDMGKSPRGGSGCSKYDKESYPPFLEYGKRRGDLFLGIERD